jgi:hypothetical protein
MEKQGHLPVFPAIFFTFLLAALATACSFRPAEQLEAIRILTDTGVRGGLIVQIGSGDGRLTRALCAGRTMKLSVRHADSSG